MSKIIIELGGSTHRINKTIEVYHKNPDALILISTEGNPQLCLDMLKKGKVPESNYIFDFNAWDTVTNFTETYKFIRSKGTKQLYVVTDRFHMKRSMTIAQNVYLLTGVEIIPCESLEGNLKRVESDKLISDDFKRSLLWRTTGFLWYDKKTKEERMPDIERLKSIAQKIVPMT